MEGTRKKHILMNCKAISPSISTAIITSAIVVLLIVTIVFTNNFLDAGIAENEFSSMKQFMQTAALQIDDVAWTIGRTQTLHYATRFGSIQFMPNALNYSIYIKNGENYILKGNFSTGIILFNMPISKYSVGNNYHEPKTITFLQVGATAPICQVFVVEKVPMNNENYIRVVVIPSIRVLNLTNNIRFYLPILIQGSHPSNSHVITLIGKNVKGILYGDFDAIKITVSFPKSELGYTSDFFNFQNTEEIIDTQGKSVQFYVSEVMVRA
ncbi:hypothetical protein J7L49_01890 [Candidatus Bathyarchaeota archaeon]|nr:hypothetical protein [Candidatus Bathyarchaeota archaeon]